MSASLSRSMFWKGVRDGAPFILVIAPFGLLFGVVATEAGLDLIEAVSFSVAVIAGAAQFTSLQLMSDGLPTVIVLASALAVNLRMAMYSASLTPHLGGLPIWKRAMAAYFMVDQAYAVSILEFETHPDRTPAEKFAYFMGVVTPICPLWYAATAAGAIVGSSIPDSFALDFAVPITFLALIAPALRTLAHVAAAGTSVVLALVLADLPYNLGLLLAALGAMLVGAQVELYTTRQRAAS